MNQKGGYQMQSINICMQTLLLMTSTRLTSTVVDLRALATVTTLTTSGETDAGIQFDKATEVHLIKACKVPRFTVNNYH